MTGTTYNEQITSSVRILVFDFALQNGQIVLHKLQARSMSCLHCLHFRAQHPISISQLLLCHHGVHSVQGNCTKLRYHARCLWWMRFVFFSQRMSVPRLVCCEQTERRDKTNKQHNTNRNCVMSCT